MAISEVSKINIIGHKKDQKEIIEIIQDSGVVEIRENFDERLDKPNINSQITEVDYNLAKIKFGLSFLEEYNNVKKTLSEKLNSKIELSEKELSEKVKSFNLQEIVEEIQKVQEKINIILNEIEKNRDEKSRLIFWENIPFIPSSKNLPSKIAFKFFILRPQIFQNFEKEVSEKLFLYDLQAIEENKKEVRSFLIYNTDSASILSNILDNLGIKPEEIPEIDSDVKSYIAKIDANLLVLNEKLEKEKQSAKKLVCHINSLKILFDYYIWQKDKLIALQKVPNGWQTFSVIGWIERKMIKKIEKDLSSVTNDFIIEEIEPEKDEVAPIIFSNNWSSPFEFVTNIYGAPKQGDPDPTPFLAPFFIIFFGLCLTDAGYGIILALLAWLGIKFLKLEKESKKMFLVLMYGGIATFFAGALVGGWFGIVIDNITINWLRDLLISIRIIDPVKNPIGMLLFSLGLGVIQILTGIIISLWWKIKNGAIESAILDNGVWLYFLISIMIFAGHQTGIINFELSSYLALFGVLLIVLTQGRKEKNPFLKIINGVMGLYGLVGYLSDVLSYSRLLALGLATGIIGMVVNLIASLSVEMVPYFGYIIAVVIIIGGHTFNIAINALGSFIHSSRLQFVEFFPKFMEGGGVMLVPLKKESKYIKIIK